MLIQVNRYSAVTEWGEDLLLRYPNNGELHLNLAYAYVKLKDPDEADYFLSTASRMIRSNAYLQQKAAVIQFLIEPEKKSAEDGPWFHQPPNSENEQKIDLPNLLFALRHEKVSLSEEWLQYITSKSDSGQFTYLLKLTQAWAYFKLGDLSQADQVIDECWDQGCYTHPEAYLLRYKIAVSQGKTEKADEIQTELEERGVSWVQ